VCCCFAVEGGREGIETGGYCCCEGGFAFSVSYGSGLRRGEQELPEPGIPDMAIKRRWVGGVDWNLAGLGG
jgi:hypothetical protein